MYPFTDLIFKYMTKNQNYRLTDMLKIEKKASFSAGCAGHTTKNKSKCFAGRVKTHCCRVFHI